MSSNKTADGGSRESRVSSCWGALSGTREDKDALRKVAWAEHPLIEMYINRRISGDEDGNWVDWAFRDFLKGPVELGLSIGCGSGYIERSIIDKSYSKAMVGVDISEEALELARKEAGDRPIEYKIFDLNKDVFEESKYDFIISAAALHHVTNLEHCFSQLHHALKPEGMLIMHEYVGPNRFQWSPEQLEVVNRIYSHFPSQYRYNHLTGANQEKVERKPLVHMIQADPSEAVRSAEILGIMGRFFDVVEMKEIGGTLLHPLLEGVIGNFTDGDELGEKLIRMLVALEERMLESGYLDADFIALVAKKGHPGLSSEEAMREGIKHEETINMQEEEILALNRRLVEAEVQSVRLRELIDEQSSELEALKKEREMLLQENTSLKSRGPLKYLKYLHARMTRRR
ncbi:MAG: methyltransferase domain-containing protein [Actinobacteria bacterium]|nr:methyltransferase domain-containing protein [Actinomycetota bacterium]